MFCARTEADSSRMPEIAITAAENPYRKQQKYGPTGERQTYF
jgi:hypothetical protein